MILILKIEKELFFGIIQDMIDDLDPKIIEEFNLEYLEVRSEMIAVDPNPYLRIRRLWNRKAHWRSSCLWCTLIGKWIGDPNPWTEEANVLAGP